MGRLADFSIQIPDWMTNHILLKCQYYDHLVTPWVSVRIRITIFAIVVFYDLNTPMESSYSDRSTEHTARYNIVGIEIYGSERLKKYISVLIETTD